ncbi:SanA/YdcF family protein, partial [Salmonella enterica subsp. enterica serovar Infantis]
GRNLFVEIPKTNIYQELHKQPAILLAKKNFKENIRFKAPDQKKRHGTNTRHREKKARVIPVQDSQKFQPQPKNMGAGLTIGADSAHR